jgi:8-oxo-dGTP diphosphatase
MKKASFIVRVYGIFMDEKRRILLSDEIVFGQAVTKFPGGGLEYGEGLKDCLHRELMEETGHEFEIGEHFYTTDFFIESAYHPQKQLISVYYLIDSATFAKSSAEGSEGYALSSSDGLQKFRWVELDTLNPELMTFPVDKIVAGLLTDRFIQ